MKLVTLLVSLVVLALGFAAPAAAQAKKVRVGVISPGVPPPGPLEAFRAGLRERGYVEAAIWTSNGASPTEAMTACLVWSTSWCMRRSMRCS